MTSLNFSTIFLSLLIATVCLMNIGCAGAPNSDESYEKELYKNDDDKRQDFVLRRRLADGEEELYVYSKNVYSSKLSLSHPDLYAVSVVVSTDGSCLVKSIFDTDGRLTDCDILENEEVIEKFVKEVQDSVNDRAKSVTANVTFSFLTDGSAELADDEAQLVDLQRQKMTCKKLQKAADKTRRSQKIGKSKGGRWKRSYLIFPGTNWCGKGNKAEYATHMGLNSEEDKCCRQHDMCPFAIEGFTSRFNVFNYRLHTLSHCDCDKAFKDCLKNADSGTANVIGKVYFNVVNTQCFDLKLEKTCAKRSWWGTCDKHKTEWVADVTTLGNY